MKLISINSFQDVNIPGLTHDDLIAMYIRYLIKLRPYNKMLRKPNINIRQIAEDEVMGAIKRKDTELVIFDNAEYIMPRPVGFAIIGKYPNSYSKDDIYIQEFFVAETRCGYGKEAIDLILKEYDAKNVSLFILDENFPARLFWKNTMDKLGFKELTSTGEVTPPQNKKVRSVEEDTVFRYYRKKES